MDFTKFDSLAAASEWVHLEIEGNKLYWDGETLTIQKTDKPCRVKLKGVGSNDVFQAFERYQMAEMTHLNHLKKATGAQVAKITEQHAEKAEALMDDLIVAACDEWENIVFDGKAEPITPDRVRQLVDRSGGHSRRSIRGHLFKVISERRANLKNAA